MTFCLLVCQMCEKGTFSQIRSHIVYILSLFEDFHCISTVALLSKSTAAFSPTSLVCL